MNTHDIELPPLPKSGWALNHENAFTANDMKAYARAAIEADRQHHDRMLAHEWIRPALGLSDDAPYRFDFYAQEIEKLKADRKCRGEPVAWVAADTLNSPHPACVSSLAYMSQLDREQGREYVPLYAAPVAAQKADDARDAERYRWLRNTLTNSVGGGVEVNDDALVYQKSEPGEEVRVYWYPDTPVGFYEVHGSTIDAAIDAAMQRTSGGEE